MTFDLSVPLCEDVVVEAEISELPIVVVVVTIVSEGTVVDTVGSSLIGTNVIFNALANSSAKEPLYPCMIPEYEHSFVKSLYELQIVA